jgi:hypothetical protein
MKEKDDDDELFNEEKLGDIRNNEEMLIDKYLNPPQEENEEE